MAPKTTKNQKGIWLSITVLLGFLVAWEWAPVLFEIPPYIIPSDSSVFVAIVMMTLVGILAYVGVIFLEKRVLHYMPRKELNAI